MADTPSNSPTAAACGDSERLTSGQTPEDQTATIYQVGYGYGYGYGDGDGYGDGYDDGDGGR